MDYKGYPGRAADYRSLSTGQPKAAPIEGEDMTATKPPFGQYAPTFECRFPNPPPWTAVPPSHPSVARLPDFPRISGANFLVPPPDCGNLRGNSLYDVRQNFNAPSRFVNSAGAWFSNTKECHDNSAPLLLQRDVPCQLFIHQGSTTMAKEPYVPATQCSISAAGSQNVGSKGFQTQQDVFHQQFTCPPPSLRQSFHPATDISLQRFTTPPPNVNYAPRFNSSSSQQFCLPINQSNESSLPHVPNQSSSYVRVEPRFRPHNQLASVSSTDENYRQHGSNEFVAGTNEFCSPPLPQDFNRASVNSQEDQVGFSYSMIHTSLHHLAPSCVVSHNKTFGVREPTSNSAATSNFSNWSTNKDILHHIEPPVFKSDNLELKNDMEWIAKWSKRRKSAEKSRSSGNSGPLSMTAFRSFLIEAIRLNDKLKDIILIQDEKINCDSHCDKTTNEMVKPELDESADKDNIHSGSKGNTEFDSIRNAQYETGTVLANLPSTVSAIQRRLNEIKSIVTDEVVLATKEKLKKLTKKRNRLRRKRQKDYEEEQEKLIARIQKDKEIDNWQIGIQTELTKLKKEKEVKVAADETLFEVRRKLTEARRALAVLASIRKLRNLRKDKASHKGMHLETESDATFEERVTAQTDILKRQIDMYELEERTLEVMLETEQEANMEREKKLQKKREDERIQKYEKQLRTWLFGKEDVLLPSDPLYPYRQYYDVGSSHLGAFLRIRQEWDMYAVPYGTPGGSTVPFGWVAPVESSSDIWAFALKNQPTVKDNC